MCFEMKDTMLYWKIFRLPAISSTSFEFPRKKIISKAAKPESFFFPLQISQPRPARITSNA